MDDGINKDLGHFTLVGSHSRSLTQTTMPVRSTKRVRLVGVSIKSIDEIKIVSTAPTIVSGRIHKAPFDGPRGIWTIDLTSRTRGKAQILAKFLGVVVATLEVETVMFDSISLPIFHTRTTPVKF